MWEGVDHCDTPRNTQRRVKEKRLQLGILITVTVLCICFVVTGAVLVGFHAKAARDTGDILEGTQHQQHENGVLSNGTTNEQPDDETTMALDPHSTTESTGIIHVMNDELIPTSRWPTVTDEDLINISRSLWNLDHNRIPLQEFFLDPQGQTNKSEKVDRAPNRLFARLDADLDTWSSTFARFLPLLDNYNALVGSEEQLTAHNWQEIANFVDAVLETEVMRTLKTYFISRGYISPDENAFRERLFTLWFQPYARSRKYNETDSSGFEHVFVGEIRKTRVIGFHNWIQFYQQELISRLNYQGYITFRYNKPRFINTRLMWHSRMKREASFLVGVSPEYDMALYSLCIVTRVGRPCPVEVDGEMLNVQSFDIDHVPQLQVGTAFPDVITQ